MSHLDCLKYHPQLDSSSSNAPKLSVTSYTGSYNMVQKAVVAEAVPVTYGVKFLVGP